MLRWDSFHCLILRGARRSLVDQCPELSSPSSEAQASRAPRAPRPCQPHRCCCKGISETSLAPGGGGRGRLEMWPGGQNRLAVPGEGGHPWRGVGRGEGGWLLRGMVQGRRECPRLGSGDQEEVGPIEHFLRKYSSLLPSTSKPTTVSKMAAPVFLQPSYEAVVDGAKICTWPSRTNHS